MIKNFKDQKMYMDSSMIIKQYHNHIKIQIKNSNYINLTIDLHPYSNIKYNTLF